MVTLQDIEGPKVVVLWSLTCVPCIKLLMALQGFEKEMIKRGIQVVPLLISSDMQQPKVYWQTVVYFLAKSLKGGSWQTYFSKLTPYYDSAGKVFDYMRIHATPTILFLSKTNQVVERREGMQDWSSVQGNADFMALLDKLVEAP
jgi:thiol-disulfide isomerase/thioredoxin